MRCRANCGACCIAPTITSELPNMQDGKPSGVYCANLNPETFACNIWEKDNYPDFCRKYKPCEEICGSTKEQALTNIYYLDEVTSP